MTGNKTEGHPTHIAHSFQAISHLLELQERGIKVDGMLKHVEAQRRQIGTAAGGDPITGKIASEKEEDSR